MEIRFISTMTSDDEEAIAPILLRAAATILDATGLAYTIRIETTTEKVFQHHHPAAASAAAHDEPQVAAPRATSAWSPLNPGGDLRIVNSATLVRRPDDHQ